MTDEQEAVNIPWRKIIMILCIAIALAGIFILGGWNSCHKSGANFNTIQGCYNVQDLGKCRDAKNRVMVGPLDGPLFNDVVATP